MTLKIYAIYLAVCSLLTFTLYVADKRAAVKGNWRISEKCLLLLSFFGGAVGGYIAMNLVRHKTRKGYFHFVNVVGILWQIAVLVWLIHNPSLLF